jgi:hypothetical protein
MASLAQIAARLLRDATTFFRNVALQNEPLREQLHDNAAVYEQVADLVESNPNGVVAAEDDAPRLAGKANA